MSSRTQRHSMATRVLSALKDFDEDQHPRDDHGRFSSGGEGSHVSQSEPLVQVGGHAMSSLATEIPGPDASRSTDHLVAQVDPAYARGDKTGWESDNPKFPMPAEVQDIPVVRGQGVLRSDDGMEMQAYNDARTNITQVVADAGQHLDAADRYAVTIGKDAADFSVDKETGLPHNQLGLNALQSADADLEAHFIGAPAGHPVSLALAEYGRNYATLSALVPRGQGGPLGADQWEKYTGLYDRARADLRTVYDAEKSLVTTVGNEQQAAGSYRGTKHFTPSHG